MEIITDNLGFKTTLIERLAALMKVILGPMQWPELSTQIQKAGIMYKGNSPKKELWKKDNRGELIQAVAFSNNGQLFSKFSTPQHKMEFRERGLRCG